MNIHWLGQHQDYAKTLAQQEDLVNNLRQKIETHSYSPKEHNTLLLLEHAPIYTIGRTRDTSSLHPTTSHAQNQLPYPVVEINRGGQATYHGPGQLVAYPILFLDNYGRDIHRYVRTLEQALIDTCAHYGIKTQQREGLTGVWVENRKLASIGIGIKRWITMHGIAINIENQALPPFLSITPCGIEGVTMTSLEKELPTTQKPPTPKEFGYLFARHLAENLTQLAQIPTHHNHHHISS